VFSLRGGVTENYDMPVRIAALRVDNRKQNIPPLAQSKTVAHSTTKAGFRQEVQLIAVRGSVHHRIIHIEITNKMQQCIKIYYPMFI
jgi:hypothetical protein